MHAYEGASRRRVPYAPHLMARVPCTDSLPASPVDWQPIPLGAGQEPTGFVHDGAFQYTQDQYGSNPLGPGVRRNPDEDWLFIVRVPERP